MVAKKTITPKTSQTKGGIKNNLPSRVKKTRQISSKLFILLLILFFGIFISIIIRSVYGEYIKSQETESSVLNRNASSVTIVKCPEEFNPVCGTNGVTYDNLCELEKAGTSVQSAGDCRNPIVFTGTEKREFINKPTGIMLNHGHMGHGVQDSDGHMDHTNTDIARNETVSGEQISTSDLQSGFPIVPDGWLYKSDIFAYSIVFPKFSYYAVYRIGSTKGDVIVVDVTEDGVKSPEGGLVRVTFTKPGQSQPIDSKKTINIVNGTLSLSYREPLTPRGQEIVDMITATAQ